MEKINNLIIFDGVCGLCHAWVRLVLRYDSKQLCKFAPYQSDHGQAALRLAGLPTDRIETLVFLHNEQVYIRSRAVFKVFQMLPMPLKLLSVLRVIPYSISDFIYDHIATSRYKLFGQKDESCLISENNKDRFL